MCWVDIVIPIVSSIIGGLLTLGGVAWTINNNKEEKSKEEHQKVCPYLKVVNINDDEITTQNIVENNETTFIREELPVGQCTFNYVFNNITLKNISQSLVIFYGLKVGYKLIKLSGHQVVEKNDFVVIDMSSIYLPSVELQPTMQICVMDSLRKPYYFDVKLESINPNCYKGDCKVDDLYTYLYKASLISLPKDDKEGLAIFKLNKEN